MTVSDRPDAGAYSLLNTKGQGVFTCYQSAVWQKDDLNIQQVLGIQSKQDTVEVNKNDYSIFDQQTLSNITHLYSNYPAGYSTSTDAIGFSTPDWYYEFSFTNPSQATNQNTFVISVNTQANSSNQSSSTTTSTSNISVAGMQKYTDSNFGFSFWYPSSWTVQQVSPKFNPFSGGTVNQVITVGSSINTQTVAV